MKTKTRQSFWAYFAQRTKSNWLLFAIMLSYVLFSIGSSIYFGVTEDIRNCWMSLVYLLFVPLFYILEKLMNIRVPIGYAIIYMVFMYGNFIGACYNLYTYFPNLDDVLHALWGIVFMILGFSVIKLLLGEPETKKAFFACLIFAFAFCLMSSVFWEIYEFTWNCLDPNYDLQEDTIINSINSFLLYPDYDHLHTEQINGIAYTILYNANGEEIYRIEGGYLDIGIIDTMWDLIWCTVACGGLFLVLALDWCLGKKWLYRFFIPKLLKEKKCAQPAVQEVAAVREAAAEQSVQSVDDEEYDGEDEAVPTVSSEMEGDGAVSTVMSEMAQAMIDDND